MAIPPINPNYIGKYICLPKQTGKSGNIELAKQLLFRAPGNILLNNGVTYSNPLTTVIGLIMSIGSFAYNWGRSVNRFEKGLFFKFENMVGQNGLEKFSKIDFSKLKGINLNNLVKGKIKVTSKEADEFIPIAKEVISRNPKTNFNILHVADIFKLTK